MQFIRGLPGSLLETPEKGLRVAVDNGARGKIVFHDLDILMLAVGMETIEAAKKLQEMLGLQLTPDGFFLEAHPKLQPVDAATRGIFFAGCAEAPKDIKESVTQGSAAAARVVRLLHAAKCSPSRLPPRWMPKNARSAANALRSAPTGRFPSM